MKLTYYNGGRLWNALFLVKHGCVPIRQQETRSVQFPISYLIPHRARFPSRNYALEIRNCIDPASLLDPLPCFLTPTWNASGLRWNQRSIALYGLIQIKAYTGNSTWKFFEPNCGSSDAGSLQVAFPSSKQLRKNPKIISYNALFRKFCKYAQLIQ